MKRLLSIILAITMLFSFAVPCSATTVSPTEDTSNSTNDIIFELTESKTRGTSAPTEGWNCESQGKLSFNGSASYSTLWLNKLVYGCLSYTVKITNNSSTTLSFDPRGCVDLSRCYVPAKSTETFHFLMNSTSDYFCITFNAPSNFSGSISCNCLNLGG